MSEPIGQPENTLPAQEALLVPEQQEKLPENQEVVSDVPAEVDPAEIEGQISKLTKGNADTESKLAGVRDQLGIKNANEVPVSVIANTKKIEGLQTLAATVLSRRGFLKAAGTAIGLGALGTMKGVESIQPQESEAKKESSVEKVPTKDEIVSVIGRFAEKCPVTLEKSDESGIYLLDAVFVDPGSGEVTEYKYQRKGGFRDDGKNNGSSETAIDAYYYMDQEGYKKRECIGAKSVAVFNEERREWKNS